MDRREPCWQRKMRTTANEAQNVFHEAIWSRNLLHSIWTRYECHPIQNQLNIQSVTPLLYHHHLKKTNEMTYRYSHSYFHLTWPHITDGKHVWITEKLIDNIGLIIRTAGFQLITIRLHYTQFSHFETSHNPVSFRDRAAFWELIFIVLWNFCHYF